MIKINLLPKTINQKAILRNTAIAFGVGLIAVIAAGFVFASKLDAEITAMKQQLAYAEEGKARVEQLNKQADNFAATTDPMQKKLDFIKAVLQYNLKYPELYAEVTKWTYEKVEYVSMSSDGSNVTMSARVRKLEDLGRFMLNMYRAKDLFDSVSITGVQGGDAGQAAAPAPGGMPAFQGAPMAGGGGPSGPSAGIGVITSSVQKAPIDNTGWITFSVNCKLKSDKVITAPQFAGSTNAATQGS